MRTYALWKQIWGGPRCPNHPKFVGDFFSSLSLYSAPVSVNFPSRGHGHPCLTIWASIHKYPFRPKWAKMSWPAGGTLKLDFVKSAPTNSLKLSEQLKKHDRSMIRKYQKKENFLGREKCVSIWSSFAKIRKTNNRGGFNSSFRHQGLWFSIRKNTDNGILVW